MPFTNLVQIAQLPQGVTGKVVESGSPDGLMQKEGWFDIYNRLEEYGWNFG